MFVLWAETMVTARAAMAATMDFISIRKGEKKKKVKKKKRKKVEKESNGSPFYIFLLLEKIWKRVLHIAIIFDPRIRLYSNKKKKKGNHTRIHQ